MNSGRSWKIRNILTLALSLIWSMAHAQYWVFLDWSHGRQDELVSALHQSGCSVIGSSEWLQALCLESNEIDRIEQLAFVRGIIPLKRWTVEKTVVSEDYAYGKGDWQLSMLGLDSLHRLGYTGKNVTIGVFDGGFHRVDSIGAFDSLRQRNGIIAHYDFDRDSALSWNESTHGMQVLALLAAVQPDSLVGSAPGADYVLARTEVVGSERHQEEFNWVRAMEWADAIGVDIIHSSLGYSLFDSLEGDYSYADMDGNSTIITIAAELAASRGIFITNSAGNSGNDPWRYITAPCDGEHVFCVGAVDSFGDITAFSSVGPSSDGRIKPDLVAMGRNNSILDQRGLLRTGSGTSFSAPLIAGAVACLMQAEPDRSNEAIRQAILMSCDRYDQPDTLYGYGLPDMVKALEVLRGFNSTEETHAFRARAYPNPAQNSLQLMSEVGSSWSVRDASGKEVMIGTSAYFIEFLDVSHLSRGTYLLTVQKDGRLVQQHIVLH